MNRDWGMIRVIQNTGRIINMNEYLYKYYPIVNYALNSLAREDVCFNSMSAFNDIQEGKFSMAAREAGPFQLKEKLAARIAEDYSDLIIFKVRVLSLTKSCDMNYMWENYAKNGTGFCIEYKYQNLQDISTDLKKIDYCNDKTPNAYFEDTISELDFSREVQKILFTKEENWKDECEVRLIYVMSQEEIELTDINDFLENKWNQMSEYEYTSDIMTRMHYKCPKRIMKKCVPNKVYLGPDIEKKDEDRIRSIISGRQYTCEKMIREKLH